MVQYAIELICGKLEFFSFGRWRERNACTLLYLESTLFLSLLAYYLHFTCKLIQS